MMKTDALSRLREKLGVTVNSAVHTAIRQGTEADMLDMFSTLGSVLGDVARLASFIESDNARTWLRTIHRFVQGEVEPNTLGLERGLYVQRFHAMSESDKNELARAINALHCYLTTTDDGAAPVDDEEARGAREAEERMRLMFGLRGMFGDGIEDDDDAN